MNMRFAKPLSERPSPSVPIYDARDMTRDGDVAHIKLDEQVYTLRITRAGKLILTK